MSVKVSYLQTIQNVINRLANNSFVIKGWTVTLVAAMIAITAKDIALNKRYVLFACLPALLFWILDAFYLSQERRYKKLFDHARKLSDGEVDFALDTKPFKCRENSWVWAVFSTTLVIFYGTILATLFLVYYLL